jgi:hypothetical protein
MRGLFTALGVKKLTCLGIPTSGWVVSVFVIGITILLFVNWSRVVINAKNNYEVYLYEKMGWAELVAQRDQLKKDLEFYSSLEYKRLYARDYLHLAESGVTLYKIVGSFNYYELNAANKDLFPRENYTGWWLLLL